MLSPEASTAPESTAPEATLQEMLRQESEHYSPQMAEQMRMMEALRQEVERLSARLDATSSELNELALIEQSRKATQELVDLLSGTVDPEEDRVVSCIRRRADICHYDSSRMPGPVLHMLASRGLVEPLRVALLERDENVDLRVRVIGGNTLLQTILLCDLPEEKVNEMLKIVRVRLGNIGVSTTVDWEQKNAAGDDVVNAAARHGRLHLFWKHFESHNYWDDKMPGEIELWVRPQREDWELLGVQNQRYFSGEGVELIEGRHSIYTDWPPVDPISRHAEHVRSTPTLRFDGAVGVDLGTTNSCVAVWQNETVEVIPNPSGYRTTPSYVSFTENGLLIGEAAKNHASVNASNTVWDVLRLLGRRFTEPVVQAGLKYWPFKVVEGQDGKALIQVEFMGERRDFTPEEVCSMILFHLKEMAEDYLGKQVKKVVLTVPAYFNFAQRTALHRAGKRAGLDVLRIITASTAVLITYGMRIMEGPERNVLVVDVGGDSCNVTLMTVEGGILEGKAVSGEHSLGGEDIDSLLVNFFIEEFKNNTGQDLSSSPRALRRLRTACEQAKRTLSSAMEVRVPIEALYDSVDFDVILTRTQFETLCGELLAKVVPVVERVLKDGQIPKHAVHDVVVVGGCSRIPVLQRLLSDYFDGKPVKQSVSADEAAVCGAAIQAFILTGGKSTQMEGLLLLNVTSRSLGLEICGGMTAVIRKNTTIPTKKTTMVFTTCCKNQAVARIRIFEWVDALMTDCCFLGEFDLSDLPAADAGKQRIEITFDMDANNVLNVCAGVLGTDIRRGICISADTSTAVAVGGMRNVGENSESVSLAVIQ